MSELLDNDYAFFEPEEGEIQIQGEEGPIDSSTTEETVEEQCEETHPVDESPDSLDDQNTNNEVSEVDVSQDNFDSSQELRQSQESKEVDSYVDDTGLDVTEKEIEHLHERVNDILSKHKKAIPFLGEKQHSIGTKVCPTRHGCKGATNCDYDYGSYSF